MKNIKEKLFGLLALFLAIFSFGLGQKALAAEDSNVKVSSNVETVSGRVFYDTDHLYTMHGTKGGQAWTDTTASLAVSYPDGHNEMVFCVAPGVPLVGGMWTDGYEGIESGAVDREAMIAASIWQDVFPSKTQHEEIASRAVVWQYLKAYNLNITSIDGIPEFPQLEKKLMDAVDNYKKVPSFDGETVKLTYGETTKLDSGGVDLNAFDGVQTNSANVNFEIASDGMSANVTPTNPEKADGKYQAVKTTMWGTPIIWTHANSQTVVTPHISDPANFTVNWTIESFGSFQVKKVDKETGAAVPGTKFKLEYTNLPEAFEAKREVTTDKNGLSPKVEVPAGVHVTATEISVPSPYVLGSALGESDVVEGDITAGSVITLTQQNVKAKGQITVEKQGEESRKALWNQNYTLAGNTFEIHKDSAEGEVVATISTDAAGHAESGENLPLGTYVVTEKTASNGFANTFKPVTVKIEYANQTTAVIVKGAEGTNQEVVGSTLLTKEDAETGKETQGRATFDGATYGLFNEDGTPVKWSESFKPTTAKGNKLDGDEVKFEISDKEQQASVEHLALGNYYWQELIAPEGYQIDNTKREFSITYKDQDTKVIETQSTSKENVIKFSLDGFKYVDSKSGDSKSGYNGIDFTLNPIDPTKGEERKTTTVTDANGYDGYWAFNEVPYGDYKMSEVKAPDGYKTIKDLIINSKFNSEKREYTFTITEDGQKEPIKTLTVPEAKINEGSNVIHLSKLFLTNKVQEMPTIRTKATVDGEKTFTPEKNTQMQDIATITNAQKGVEYTNKIKLWRLINDDTKSAKLVWSGSHDFEAKGGKEEDVIKQLVDTSKDDNTVSYVFTEELFIKDGPKVAEHNDLENKDQTIRPILPGVPTIETLFVTKNGGKTFDPTVDNELIDEVKATVPKEDLGKTFYYVTKFHKIDKDGKETVVGTDESEHVAKELTYEFKAVFNYKANTLKDGEKLVATHVAYSDKEHKHEYAKHYDLKNEKQTLTAKTPTTPAAPKTTTPGTSIPQTSGTLSNPIVWAVLAVVVVAAAAIYFTDKKRGQNN